MKGDEDACSRDSRSTARVRVRGAGVQTKEQDGGGEGLGALLFVNGPSR